MQAIIPDVRWINDVLTRLASSTPPSNAELMQVLSAPIVNTQLDRWSMWTLICLRRHLDRQKWVGYIVESRLKGDLRQIGCAGAFGHPEGLPQLGKVPDEPDWNYYFHGCGCCLTNDVTGSRIDVDFSREGDSDKIDRFFYTDFLLSLTRAGFPEDAIRRREPLQHAWQVEIDRLSAASCVETEHGLRLTLHGIRVAEALEPLGKKIAQLLEWETISALRAVVYAALAVGDVILASQVVPRADVSAELQTRIDFESERARRSRMLLLEGALGGNASYRPAFLSALADLGPEFSEEAVIKRLFQSPVDGVANTALEILCWWNRPTLVGVLKELLNRRYSEASGFSSFLRRWRTSRSDKADREPRNYQVIHATVALFQRVRPDSLDARFKAKIRFLIENAGGAQAGEAALLMYLLDTRSGLQRLRSALSGDMPAAHQDAAAACVIIGNEEAKEILKDALSNQDAQIQHTAACALTAFPSEDAKISAREWLTRNDGIKEPLGKEVTVLGRTTPVFTFEDISHANMDMFFKSSFDRLRKDFKLIL